MKHLFSILAAGLLAASASNAIAANNNGEAPDALTYFTWEYNEELQSVDLSFPNAGYVTYNGLEDVAIRKDGVIVTKGKVDYKGESLNEFTCVFNDPLEAGTYTINARTAVFTCYTSMDEETGVDTPETAFVIEFVIPEKVGTEDNPIEIGDGDGEEVPGPGAAEEYGDYTWYELNNTYDGILTITNNTNAYQTTLFINGESYCNSIPKNGGRIEALVFPGDVIRLRAMSETDESDKTYVFNYRPAEDGEIWTRPIELIEGDNIIGYVASSGNYITVPHYYVLSVNDTQKAIVDFEDFGIYATSLEATGEYVDVEKKFTFDPNEEASLFIQIKNVASATNETICNVSFEGNSGTTAIQHVEATVNGQAYDLFGRRSNTNSVVIKNGAKMLVK